MKSPAIVLLATMLLSMTASASWFVSSVSCRQTPDLATPNQVIYTSFKNDGQTISHGLYEVDNRGTVTTPLPYAGAFTGGFEAKTKVNPRDYWAGIFDVIQIYDGLILEGGHITLNDGTLLESRAEIRFVPYSDKAYGPDYASIGVWKRPFGSANWGDPTWIDNCYVSVYH